VPYSLSHPPHQLADFELSRSLRDLHALMAELPAGSPALARLRDIADLVIAEQSDRKQTRSMVGPREV
jgi:hypothetical protein